MPSLLAADGQRCAPRLWGLPSAIYSPEIPMPPRKDGAKEESLFSLTPRLCASAFFPFWESFPSNGLSADALMTRKPNVAHPSSQEPAPYLCVHFLDFWVCAYPSAAIHASKDGVVPARMAVCTAEHLLVCLLLEGTCSKKTFLSAQIYTLKTWGGGGGEWVNAVWLTFVCVR